MTESGTEKKEMVGRMFDDIAPTYDTLNHLLSLGIDRWWRRRLVEMAAQSVEQAAPRSGYPVILDVATGTGDLSIALARRLPRARVTGVDISEGMLRAGRAKVRRRGLVARVKLHSGDGEALDFPDGSFDVVTAAFGVRNFGDIPAGLGEMRRVTAPGGRCLVLEFSEPRRGTLFCWAYRLYFHRVLPFIGRAVSSHGRAYSYLPRSVDDFPTPERFAEILRRAGFERVRVRRLTFGVAAIWEATP